jgi:hypothetical protein
VHVTACTANLPGLLALPESLVTARAARVLEGMLQRGFTTVRDAGGADWGLAAAVEEGAILGPRLLFTGHALSQTGGHGDMRGKVRHKERAAVGEGGWARLPRHGACFQLEALQSSAVKNTNSGRCSWVAGTTAAGCPVQGEDFCACGAALRGIGRVCDGVPEVRPSRGTISHFPCSFLILKLIAVMAGFVCLPAKPASSQAG